MSSTSSVNEIQEEKPLTPTRTYDERAHVVHLTMYGIFLAAFLVALDRTILGTAIPKITNEFNSLSDVGWYGSAYLLTSCSFQLFLGRVYTFYNPKTVFLSLLAIFEIGSAICGAAPSSPVLIIGRAIAGTGSAGIFSGSIVIIVRIMPEERRALWTGCFGAIFGIANVIGPVLGGLFTDHLSWRWCFYINLPIGAIAALFLIFILRIPEKADQVHEKTSLKSKIIALDPIGTAIFLPSIAFLLLALQLGGTSYSWTSPHVLPFLVLSPVLLIVYGLSQYFNEKHATLPGRIIGQRSILGGTFFCFVLGATLNIIVYFLPIYFQAVKGDSAVRSGVLNLPQVVGNVIASIATGILTRKTGYYVPWMYASAVFMPLGCGLMTTMVPATKEVFLAIFQILVGLGFGFGIQQPAVAAQAVLEEKDVPIGAAMMFFSQSLGGAVMLSVANNVFDNNLLSQLVSLQEKGLDIDARKIIMAGATDFRHFTAASALPAVLDAYNLAIRHSFYIATGMAAASIFGAAVMQWRRVKTLAISE